MRNCALGKDVELTKEENFYVVQVPDEESNFSLTLGDIRFRVCPLSWIDEESFELIRLFNLCVKLGVLPDEGGLLDQDNWTMEAFEIINEEMTRLARKEAEKQRQMQAQKFSVTPTRSIRRWPSKKLRY